MSSRSPKDFVKSKLGLKVSTSKSETDLENFKKENAAIKMSMEENAIAKGKLAEKERHRLLEKIFALEAEKEKNSYHLAEKEKEIQQLKAQLNSRSSTSSLLSQLEEKTKEAERRDQLLKSLSEETEILKKQLSVATIRLSELESKGSTLHSSQNMATDLTESPVANIHEVEIQLKDALEKNQQWLIYDQQREAYVRGLRTKIFDLEQQSKAAAHSRQQQSKRSDSEDYLQEEKQKYHNHLLLVNVEKNLEAERQTVAHLSFELNECRRKYEETQKENLDLNNLLSSLREADVQHMEDNRYKTEKIQKLKKENEIVREKLEEEKKRSEDLLSQVQFLSTSLLKQQEEHTRVALLEQQIQACTIDFENEKFDRQNMQHQLHRVLKELRRAREQIKRLEPVKQVQEYVHIERSDLFSGEHEKLKTDSPKRSNLLDESFLECPKCKAQYPTSQHRELLAHIDFCEN
ncbi:centrosomal protein of 55 kDa isoform X2 [Petaurus breviceps papuanus]|uniref:centrosomal protein of 55 kDa isoform X2 n=1 Tax=Petaurus breviceps papuanus TaxID=3040969 RepID=UPI0036D9C75B